MRGIGRTEVSVSALGLGCAPLGNLFSTVSDEDAQATVIAALDAGMRHLDTAPLYGHGLSEVRLGRALAASGRTRDEYTVCTKVGRVLVPGADPTSIFHDVPPEVPVFDFSGDGVRRSLEESLRRLGLDRADVVLVHDPDDHADQAVAETFPALVRMRDEGTVGAIGAGMNQAAVLRRFVDEVDIDCVLMAGRYTLLDRSGEAFLDHCAGRGVSVFAGGVFNSGLLADPDAAGATFDYASAPPELVGRARRIAAVCKEFGVPLIAAAVQFATAHPAVACVVIGARTAGEVADDVAAAAHPIPASLWEAIA